MNDLPAAKLLDARDYVGCLSESGVGGVDRFAHDGDDLPSHSAQLLELFERAGNGAERAAYRVAHAGLALERCRLVR